jgi:hypothetical protein
VAAGKAVVAFAGGLQAAFRTIYQGAKEITVPAILSAGSLGMKMEERDVNWNLAGIALGGLVILMALLVWNGRVFL